jgi:ClpP class serine protease
LEDRLLIAYFAKVRIAERPKLCNTSFEIMANEQPEDLSVKAAAEEKADLYLYNGPINEVGYLELIRAVSDPHHAKKAILLITTYGGSAESGYKIARWFQRFYEEFWLYPTSVCASAGTLIAMGAHGLYMSPFSELGPLDVQLAKRNELGEYKSVMPISLLELSERQIVI